ncbi:GtrA family protein [Paenibacillus arenilitoris]|uniref:GtrA family protein n=1 Tax=Paenibacillus arenilitoris TaxID=2772299 RepID=A0A927CR17_9BACL|nr:GtrA family protein [Paenibacillus arenilitoris]MBD2871537.1 GtrA family protein [Paenibacillus arenilitoris]
MPGETRRRLGAQFIAFNLIGLLNTAIDFALFALLVWAGVNYVPAQAAAYAAGMASSLLLNSRITFRGTSGASGARIAGRTVLRFIAWNLFVLALSLLLLALLTELLGIGEAMAKVPVTAVTAVVNFFGSKRWVFAARSEGERG